MTPTRPAAILDVDGTLVDTNYHHALAWHRALRRHGATVPLWVLHRHMGMGGDQLVGSVAGEDFDSEHGEDARAAEKEEYAKLIDEVVPLPEAVRRHLASPVDRLREARAAGVGGWVDLTRFACVAVVAAGLGAGEVLRGRVVGRAAQAA